MENLETRNKIIETAAEQFMRFGVRSVTMDDIARQAGMSKKTIYQEFADCLPPVEPPCAAQSEPAH